jgi:hypothetical protein
LLHWQIPGVTITRPTAEYFISQEDEDRPCGAVDHGPDHVSKCPVHGSQVTEQVMTKLEIQTPEIWCTRQEGIE